MTRQARDMLRTLSDLILPRQCAGCGAAGEVLCPRCIPGQLPFALPGFGVPVLAAARYERGVRAAVLAYKERGRRELTRSFAVLLAETAAGLMRPGATLVPVPSARAAARRRGGDHVRRLARRAAAQLGVSMVPALRLTRLVRASAELGAAERHANLAGAMAAHAPPAGAAAVLVDDIVTTGATVHEAMRALRVAGWPVLGGLAVAVTPLRSSGVSRI
jgi:predicted amidophosphoribosyltransferase